MNVFSVVLGNIVTIVCFSIVSIYFNNPWLILLALLFYQNHYTEFVRKGTDEEKEEDYDVD